MSRDVLTDGFFLESHYSIQVVKCGSSAPSTVEVENKGVRFLAFEFKRKDPAANVQYLEEYLQGQLLPLKKTKIL